MSDSAETGWCDICNKYGPVTRTYYYYDIKCECCQTSNGKHFEVVRTCADCAPSPPRKIGIVIAPLPADAGKEGEE